MYVETELGSFDLEKLRYMLTKTMGSRSLIQQDFFAFHICVFEIRTHDPCSSRSRVVVYIRELLMFLSNAFFELSVHTMLKKEAMYLIDIR